MFDALTRLSVAILVVGALLAGCQVIGSSIEYAELPDGSRQQTCSSALGSYSLAYSTIEIKISQDFKTDNTPQGGAYLSALTPKRHPDPKHKYCLEFLEAALADDKVDVYYSGPRSTNSAGTAAANAKDLLQLIVSKNVDRTGEVIRKLLRLIFIVVSGDPDDSFGRAASGTTQRTMTEQEFDPFDVTALMRLNESIREYGFCLTLGKFTYDVEAITPDQYCNNPGQALRDLGRSRHLEAAKNQHYLKEKLPTGIFYRPRQSYPLFVFVRDDPAVGPWKLRKVETVLLENISPIMVLGVNRTLFAKHRTAMAFDDGDLLDFCVAKGSSVEGFIQIPLDVIYGIVSLPSVTISAELALKGKQIGLFEAQKKVIEAQSAYLDFLADSTKAKVIAQQGKPLAKSNLDFAGGAFDASSATSGPPAAADFCGEIKDD
jgi:hypothetical protein